MTEKTASPRKFIFYASFPNTEERIRITLEDLGREDHVDQLLEEVILSALNYIQNQVHCSQQYVQYFRVFELLESYGLDEAEAANLANKFENDAIHELTDVFSRLRCSATAPVDLDIKESYCYVFSVETPCHDS